MNSQKAACLGCPSYVWRDGQERRLQLIRQYIPLEGARILDVGCGLGLYVQQFLKFTSDVHGIDIDHQRVQQAQRTLPNILQASAEDLPYPSGFFDIVFSNEVLEHVRDDRAAVQEAYRVLRPYGHLVVFAPNRLYPFETHGCFVRGKYYFGNIPLINYLPNSLRRRLCPHVRAYTKRGLQRLFADLPGKFVVHRCIFAGYDRIALHHLFFAKLLRETTYRLEHSPFQFLGLSHLVIFEKHLA